MFTRPFLPFRVQPLRTPTARPAVTTPADIFSALATLKPLTVKAERRVVKAEPVVAASRNRPPVRAVTRLA